MVRVCVGTEPDTVQTVAPRGKASDHITSPGWKGIDGPPVIVIVLFEVEVVTE